MMESYDNKFIKSTHAHVTCNIHINWLALLNYTISISNQRGNFVIYNMLLATSYRLNQINF